MPLFSGNRKAKRELEARSRFRWEYENLRQLLALNSRLLETLAEIQSYIGSTPPKDAYSYYQISTLINGIALMVESLNNLSGNKFPELYEIFNGIAGKLQRILISNRGSKKSDLLLPLDKVNRSMTDMAGGKAAYLSELRKIFPENIPEGFVITTSAYYDLLNDNNLTGQMRALISGMDISNQAMVEAASYQIKRYVENCLIPKSISDEIERYMERSGAANDSRWAVRSSAVGEDGTFSFAGQFDSVLNVPVNRLARAYLKVVSSRFKPNALIYRLSHNIKESECPMAVLFIKMIDAKSSGVIYTQQPGPNKMENMFISAVHGLAGDLLSGKVAADSFLVNRREPNVINQILGKKESMLVPGKEEGVEQRAIFGQEQDLPSISLLQVKELAQMAFKIEKYFGMAFDIEWAIDNSARCWILQARPLRTFDEQQSELEESSKCRLLAEGGVTIFPGRAQGRLHYCPGPEELAKVKGGEILLIKKAAPEIVSVFQRITGLITEFGHPTSHAAAMAREFGIPAIFNLAGAEETLHDAAEIGLDASHKKIYAGLPWPDMPKREISKSSAAGRDPTEMENLLFRLNLIDPEASNFTPKGCVSMHDIIRFVHERAVVTLFAVGDNQVTELRDSFKTLKTAIPLNLTLFHIGNVLDQIHAKEKSVRPENVKSEPFQALWRGISDPQIKWTGRSNISLAGLASVVTTSVVTEGGSGRRIGERNYLIVSPDYINMNARLAYHYSMVDAMVCKRTLNNYINFRFRGGGAGRTRRGFRARFIAAILSYEGFSVDRREDLITAWYKGYDRNSSNKRLEILGRLMGCARQLDMLLDSREKTEYYVAQFMNGNYKVFE